MIISINTLRNSRFCNDSFWAVFGNGIGSALMLLSGVLIARLLGKDIYGEYGLVKSTTFYIASFATFGLGFTSTKFIASFTETNPNYIKSISRDAITITLLFSSAIALFLIVFAKPLAGFVDSPSLVFAFRALAVIVVVRALTTTQIGLLAGLKKFKEISYNSMASGGFMLASCVPLTYFWGLPGSLFALLCSQICNSLINFISIKKHIYSLPNQEKKNFKKKLVVFSFPVALQESSFTICHWTAIMLLTKFSSTGELALYTAAAQWNAIVVMIPGLLSNVVLSYLSTSAADKRQHVSMVGKMLLINFLCSVLPFIIVWIGADLISSFYGASFTGLARVLRLLVVVTIFETCASVFKFDFLSLGKTWQLFGLRLIRDSAFLILTYVILHNSDGTNAAMIFSSIYVGVGVLYFMLSAFYFLVLNRKRDISLTKINGTSLSENN